MTTKALTSSSFKSLAVPLMALALVFAGAGAANIATVTHAEAGKVKIVKKGGKLLLKGIGRAGKAASRSRVKFVKKAGHGMQKVSKKGGRGIDKASKGGTRLIRKTKAGRTVHNTWRNAGRWKTKKLNEAFRRCRGKACNFGKGVIDIATPL